MQSNGGFGRFLTPQELKQLYGHHDKVRGRLPSWRAAFCMDDVIEFDRTSADFLGDNAARLIEANNEGRAWLQAQKHRFLPGAKHSEVASAMAELRCYGALLEAGYEVTPLLTTTVPTPDFKVVNAGETFFIEVASKQEAGAETALSKKIAEGKTPPGVTRDISEKNGLRLESIISTHHPFGAPDPSKKHDSVQANAISKLCAVKGTEAQANEATTLLWIDLRDLSQMGSVVSRKHFDPIIAGGRDGQLTSGCVWYSFYGWKGAPIFEESFGHRDNIVSMGHEGRFRNSASPSKFSGAMVCVDGATAFFENPDAHHKLPDAARLRLHGLPEFDIGASVASWDKDGALEKVSLQTRMIRACAVAPSRPAAGHY